MSLLNLFRTSISFISKDVIAPVHLRTCTTEAKSALRFVVKGKVENHPLEKCIRYMDSEAYKTTYGDNPVWHTYVRNYRGSKPPETRKNCIIAGAIHKSSPCPICRDHFLKVDYRNVKLLKQFISPYGGNILDTRKTGVCQAQQYQLKIAIKKARDYGYLTFAVPHRHYDYNLYKKQ